MKNILKYGCLVFLAVIMIFALTGCGSNTIIASKSDSDELVGEYDIKLDILFEGDVISLIKIAMTFKDEKIANLVASGENETNTDFVIEGNTITTELTAEEYKKIYNVDFSTMSKDEIIQQLKDEGYTVE